MNENDASFDRNEPRYTIGEVVKMTGVSKARLNDYDKKGILVPTRAKKDIDQDWRLYSEEDIDRLEKITVLLAYGFLLKEIQPIIDGEIDLYSTLEAKLADLRQQESHLRNLIFFAKFVDLGDNDLYSSLAKGPEEINELADLARNQLIYQESLKRIEKSNEINWDEQFLELDEIIEDFININEGNWIAGIEEQIDQFFAWWEKCLGIKNESGYLCFWSIFEDGKTIPEEVMRVGGGSAAAFLQMWAFYVMMKRLMSDVDDLVSEIAQLAHKDVLLATTKAEILINIICEYMGINGMDRTDDVYSLCIHIIKYMKRIWGDPELRMFLDLEDVAYFRHEDLETCIYVLALMSGTVDMLFEENDASILKAKENKI